MNFNVYIEDSLAERLDRLSQQQGKKRNTIIREALEAWIAQFSPTTWPDEILTYTGTQDPIIFESYRSDLLPPSEIDFD